MVGLTRFLFSMNLCEKSAGLTNVYAGFWPFKKDADFRGEKKLFVLQAVSRPFSANLNEVVEQSPTVAPSAALPWDNVRNDVNLEEVAARLLNAGAKCHNLVEVGNDFGFLPQVAR
jgi:hypothetical protein